MATLILGSPPGLWLTCGASVSMSTSALSSTWPRSTWVQALRPACRRTPRIRSIYENKTKINHSGQTHVKRQKYSKYFHSDSKQSQFNWMRTTNNPCIVALWCQPQCRACWPRWAGWSRSGDWGHPQLSGLCWGCQWRSCGRTCKYPESEPQDQFSPQSVRGRPPGNDVQWKEKAIRIHAWGNQTTLLDSFWNDTEESLYLCRMYVTILHTAPPHWPSPGSWRRSQPASEHRDPACRTPRPEWCLQ